MYIREFTFQWIFIFGIDSEICNRLDLEAPLLSPFSFYISTSKLKWLVIATSELDVYLWWATTFEYACKSFLVLYEDLGHSLSFHADSEVALHAYVFDILIQTLHHKLPYKQYRYIRTCEIPYRVRPVIHLAL